MRSAAISVSVFQWPCATLATRRSPRGERPRCRTILVVTAVSSMKTRRDATSLDCSTLSSARAAATSGRSCSAACKVFFERDVVAFVKAPDRGRTGLQPLLGLEPRPNLVNRQIRLRCDQIKQPLAMRFERRTTVTRAGQCRDIARCRPAFDPADRGRGAETEHPRRFPSALAVFDKRHRTPPEVVRVSYYHRATSRLLSKQLESDLRASGNPLIVPIHIKRQQLE